MLQFSGQGRAGQGRAGQGRAYKVRARQWSKGQVETGHDSCGVAVAAADLEASKHKVLALGGPVDLVGLLVALGANKVHSLHCGLQV